jgi:predicted RNA-binding Zn-ribbon protein involved in translation (DUF1610 family)
MAEEKYEGTNQKLILTCEVCDKEMDFKGMKDGYPHFECPDCETLVKVVKED